MDNMLVKNKEELAHLDDLKETFTTLRQYQMKLNPSKCAFGVASKKFLGFMVSQRGIEANPEKVRAILDMTSPKTFKEVQKLTGRIVALNRFVTKATNKCLPFFKMLKQAFAWTDECEVAFQEFKRYLSNPPLLSPSKEGENPVSVFGNISHSCEHSLNLRRWQETAPSLLRQSCFPRGRSQVPKD